MKGFEDIRITNISKISEEFFEVVKKVETLEGNDIFNIEKNYKKEVKDFNKFIEVYNMSLNEKDVIGELDKTIKMLEHRYRSMNINK